ncbi:MAG: Cytochrome c-type biogenesis protein CcmF [Anaerolineales bacterium]|nr:Cytochrome c-type biogenesis protein CcmF [Anaerolineales bacterium]
MLAQFGYGILLITFLLSLYAIAAAVHGYFTQSTRAIESARRSMLLTFPLISLAAASLILLLVQGDYNVQFVYEVTSRSMPTYLKITAWWGGQAGSLLFWSWLMSAFATAATLRKWDRDIEFLPWVIVVASVTLAFFLALNILFEDPFARLYQTFDGSIAAYQFAPAGATPVVPADGRGLNPLLRHPGMIIHPPLLYLGFVSYVIPFAFAIAALITGRTDDRWIRLTRRWSLWAWLFLSFGLVLGGRWAYDVLGWGGYWGWDPVEIAAFMPWLTGTAFLHSVMIQEKRGMLKQWNMVLIILTYALVIFGTFLTRSGVLSSVHAFAQSAIGPSFFVFIGATFVTSIALLLHRWNDLRAEAEMKSLLSREALFLLNNLLFMSVLVVCFWGVIFPLISELFTGQKVTVGPPFYERANSPLFAALMLLMGIAPLSAWGHSTMQTLGRALWKPAIAAGLGTVAIYFTYTTHIIALIGFFLVFFVILVTLYEFWRGARARQRAQNEHFFTALSRLTGRNRRRYGGYIIHISMMLMAIGILGIELFQSETQGTVQVGESLNLQHYQLVYEDIARFTGPDGREVTRAVIQVYKDGQPVAELHPRTDYYWEAQQNMTIPGVRSTLADDVYVLLVDWEPASAIGATFKVYVNPLVNWLWLGSFLFLAGVVVAAWPDKDPESVTARARARGARQISAAD